jgi:hypothetical protein
MTSRRLNSGVNTLRNRRRFLAHGIFGMGTAVLASRNSLAADPPLTAEPKNVRWIIERISRGVDPVVGALVRQLTSATVISHAIYFNSDRTGIPQVYAAEIPEGFLAKLQSNDGGQD